MSYSDPTEEEIAQRRAELAPFDTTNERVWMMLFATVIGWQGVPRSYLDLGSGTGAMVNIARKLMIDAYGVDVINGPESWFIRHDLTQPFKPEPPRKFDLVTCIEVAEHLPEEAADTLCDTIAEHMAPHGLLVFSAAVPGQQGLHHVNLQPASYWRGKLYDRGISYRTDYTRQLAHLWAWVSGPLMWLGSNIQVFDR